VAAALRSVDRCSGAWIRALRVYENAPAPVRRKHRSCPVKPCRPYADTDVVIRRRHGIASDVDWLSSATQLAELFDNAPPMPLMRSQVRVDKRDADGLVAATDTEVRDGVAQGGLSKEMGYDIISATAQMQELLRNSHPVPLTDQVRVSRDRAADLARALRTAIRGSRPPN
jgi:hypothetical protein